MKINYFQENKVTKKTDPKEPVKVTKKGFVDENGEIKTYWDFFKDFGENYINVGVSYSDKFELKESEDEV